MKKLILLLLILLATITIPAQEQEKFIIGACWLTPHDLSVLESQTPLTDAYWDLAKNFGLNYASLPIRESSAGVSRINQVLTKAANRDIGILLENGELGNIHVNRWMYQIEGNYDFET